MSPDWTELRHLVGQSFIPDTPDPNRSWLDKYIHPDDFAVAFAGDFSKAAAVSADKATRAPVPQAAATPRPVAAGQR